MPPAEGLLDARAIVVTGAARGLGRAIAIACAAHGAEVGIAHRPGREDAASAVAGEIDARTGRAARLLAFDVTDPEAIAAAVEAFRSAAGRIDGWVNCAGVVLPDLLVSSDPERIERQIRTNLLGPILCARAVVPVMMAQRSGVILNVSSVAAVRPVRGQAVYAASKAGVEALTRALAVEYARKGVRVLCLRPGPIATDMLAGSMAVAPEEVLARIPLGHPATPEQVAEHAAFLLSERASFATGTIHTVDGGFLCS